MAVVGTAYVAIRAVTDKLRGDIEESLAGSSDAAKRAGESAGKNYSDGFNESSRDSVGPDLSRAADSASEAGRRAGENFSGSLHESASRVKVLDDSAFDSARDAARNAGRDVEDELTDGVRKASNAAEGEAGNGGRRIGDGFANGVKGSGAENALGAIGARMIALVPIISILVGTISSLVGGLFAIASAAAPAAGGLAVLPGLALAAASAFGVLRAAFGGIGKALGAGLMQQNSGVAAATKNSRGLASAAEAVARAQRGIGDAARQNADALASANRAIADAKRNLTNTLQDAASRTERSDRSVYLAERNLRDAMEKQTESQVKLTAARKDARDEILQLQFALEDSNLGQERAAISLEKARRQLQLMAGLPPDNLMRREAELSYKEAELNVRKTAEQFKKSTEAADEAQKNGVNNAKQVVDARKTEADSAEKVADAQYNLVQARKDQAKTERDNAEQIMLAQRSLTDAIQKRDRTLQDNARRTADAQQALKDALQANADAAMKASPAMTAFGRAMDNLAPAQRRFVNYLLSISGQWKALKATLAENVLGPAQSAIEEFMRGGLFEIFSKGMDGASKSVGGFFASLEGIFKTKTFKGDFAKIMQSNVKVVDDLGGTVSNLIRLLFSVTAAATPMTQRFSEWVKVITGNWADKAAGNSKKMEGFFKKAGDTAAQLGRIIANIAVGIFKLGQAATPAGQTLLDSFEKNTEKFRHWLDDPKKFDQVKKNFDDIATNVQKIGDLAKEVGKAFGRLGTDKGIGDLADSLRTKVLPVVEDLFHTLNNDAGPAIGKFLGSVADAIKAVSGGPGLDIVLGTLTALADAVTAIAKNPAGKAFLIFMSTIVGVMKSLQLVKKVFFIDNLISGFNKIDKFVQKKTGDSIKNAFKNMGDGAEDAAKRAKSAMDGLDKDSGGSGKSGRNNTPDGVDKKTAKASDSFKDNLSDLARQFVVTGDAKDAFILNLKKLQGQFALMSGGTVAKSATAASVGSVASHVDLDGGAAGAAGAASKIEDVEKRIGKSGGRMRGLFSGLGKSAGLLSTALFGVSAAELAALWPLLLVVAAIGAVILVFKGAWDHSEKLRKAWDTQLKPALDRLGKALKPLLDAVKKLLSEGLKKLGDFIADKLIPGLVKFIDWIVKNIPKVVEAAKKVFGWIKDNWDKLKYILLGPFIALVIDVVKHWDAIKKGASDAKDWIVRKWDELVGFVKSLPGKIAAAAKGIWDSITSALSSAWNWISGKFGEMVTWVKGLPGRIASAAAGLWDSFVAKLRDAAKWVWDKLNEMVGWVAGLPARFLRGASKIWNFLSDGLRSAAQWVWDKISEIVSWVAGMPGRFVRNASRLWGFLTDGLGTAKKWVTDRIDDLVGVIGGLGGRIRRAATGMWDGIKDAFRSALNWIIDKWNGLSFGIPSFEAFGKKIGGFQISTPDIPRFAKGGIVPATPGGRLAILAEANRSEKVTPLRASGMSAAEEEIISLLREQQGGQPVQILVNPPPGTDVHTLARLVSIELGFQMGR